MDKKFETYQRLTNIRAKMLKEHPFLGQLLMHLPFGFAPCGTAYTDMRKIVFDVDFGERLKDDELEFVLSHELMHCILKHCTRGKGLNRQTYNIACDIVVNSTLLEIIGLNDFSVDCNEVMHLAPDGSEGRLHSSEEIYSMLMKLPPEKLEQQYCLALLDSHSAWDTIKETGLDDVWEQRIRSASKLCGKGSGIPGCLKRYLEDVEHMPTTNWKQLLHDYIQHDRSDYTFLVPDKRYSSGNFILPSFQENICGEKIEKLWFLIDTSGSISDETLGIAYSEIKAATEQIDNLSGCISFFDTEISDPISFESVDDLSQISPVGGGGTSFHAIFEYLSENFEELPNIIIIATDGYAAFPEEDETLGVPVIWLIIDSDVTPPWGEAVSITPY